MTKTKQMFVLSLASLMFLASLSSCAGDSELKEELNNTNATKLDFGTLVGDYSVDVSQNFSSAVLSTNDLSNTEVSIIVELEGSTESDGYLEVSQKYSDVKAYTESTKGISLNNDMVQDQADVALSLLSKELISEVKGNYTILMNGFAAKTTYGNVAKIRNVDGVKDVYVSTQYSAEEVYKSSAENDTACDETTGIADNDTTYQGEGMVVAVLDSGLDYNHNAFKQDVPSATISKSDVSAVIDQMACQSENSKTLTADDVYISSKVPFAYDYADNDANVMPAESDHGTHVSGIVCGNEPGVFSGVSPNAQLCFMKVFADEEERAQTDTILLALEDAVLLNVDVINESLGSICGYSSDSEMADDVNHLNQRTNELYNRIYELGISHACSAGNDYFQAYGTTDGSNLVTNPESGNIGSPGTYTNTLAVASMSRKKSPYLLADGETEMSYVEAYDNNSKEYNFLDMIFAKYNRYHQGSELDPETDTLEIGYVVIPNLGDALDYEGLDVKGKIAVVKRGTSTFEDKIANALSAGAYGCLIYNNVSGIIRMTCGDSLALPAASLTNYYGVQLEERQTGTFKFSKSYMNGPFMSDFSSLGPNGDLTLKPEITSCGGDVLSSVIGGGYEEFSGTSMSCPNTSGILIALRQYIQANWTKLTAKPTSEMTKSAVSTLATQLLMSTAIQCNDENGNPYSPRKQGAGVASLQNCIDATTYLHVGDSDKVKLELGDDKQKTGVYTLEFNVNNTSDNASTYELKDLTMTETASNDGKTVLNMANMLSPTKTIETSDGITNNGTTITVPAHTDGKIKVTLTLSDAEKKYIDETFPNGMYVEGFIKLVSLDENGVDLSIPFLAFYGDWADAPVWDLTYYDVQSTEYYSDLVKEIDRTHAAMSEMTPYGQYGDYYMLPLGGYVYTIDQTKYTQILASEDKAAISLYDDAIYDFYTIHGGLLRSAKTLTFTVSDATTGEVIFTKTSYDNRKDTFYQNTGSILSFSDPDDYTFSVKDYSLANNTKLKVTIDATLDYGDGTANNGSIEFTFYVDYEAPILEDVQYYKQLDSATGEYRYYVDLTVSDNRYVMSAAPCIIVQNGKSYQLSMLDSNIPVYQNEAGEATTFTLELTDYMEAIHNSATPDSLYLYLDDYAMNTNLYYIALNGSNCTDLTFNTNEIVISENQVAELSDYVNLDNAMLQGFTWTSNSTKVVGVDNGQIYGLHRGVTTIQGSTQYGVTITVKIKVLGSQDEGYVAYDKPEMSEVSISGYEVLFSFDDDGSYTSKIGSTGSTSYGIYDTINLYAGESIKLNVQLGPWYVDNSDGTYTVKWKVVTKGVVVLDDDGTLTARGAGDTRIYVNVYKNGTKTNISDVIDVSVTDSIVTSGSWLMAYKGTDSSVVLDSSIKYINSYAFSLYQYTMEEDGSTGQIALSNPYIKKITLPKELEFIYPYALANLTSLQGITIPNTTTELYNNAFSGDTSLTYVTISDSSKLLKICYNAFYGDSALTTINLSHVATIGSYAFYGCTSLDNIDLTNMVYYGNHIFDGCTSLKNVTLSANTAIGNYMFANTGIESINLAQDYIGEGAFNNCTSLTSVTFTGKNVVIDKDAFKGCSSLTSVTFADSVESVVIKDGAFDGTGITSIVLPSADVTLGSKIFANTSLSSISLSLNTTLNMTTSTFSGANSFATISVDSGNSSYAVDDGILYNKAMDTIVLVPTAKVITTLKDSVVTIGNGAFSGNASTSIATTSSSLLTTIDSYAFADSKLVSFVINNENAITIKDNAFNGALSFTSLIANSISSIGKNAFTSSSIEELTLNNTEIASYAFEGATYLKNVTINGNATINDYAFYKAFTTGKNSLTINGEVAIGNYAFAEANIQTLTATKIVSIGSYAFYNASKLKSIDLANAKAIGSYAFYGCTSLKSISGFDASITSIPEYCFYGATSLTSVELSNVTSVGQFAFAKDELLQTIDLSKVETIGKQAFDSLAITSADLSSIKDLSTYAFINCTSLKTVTLPSTLKVIPQGSFYECSKLSSINLENVTSIESYAFTSCSAMTNLNLPKVEEIGSNAFQSSGASIVNIPLCKNIRSLAFYGCIISSLDMSSVEIIETGAFYGTKLKTIELPSTVKEIDANAFYYNSYLTSYTSEGKTSVKYDTWFLDDGVLYTINANGTYTLESYPMEKASEAYTIVEGTSRIQDYAFYGNEILTKVTLPTTLERIGDSAFYGCKSLLTYQFLGQKAPILEGYYSSALVSYLASLTSYPESYQALYPYAYFKDYHFYANFYEYIGLNEDITLTMIYDDVATGYDTYLYRNFFGNKVINKTVYADCTISFDTDGGSTISNIVVKEDSTIEIPETPTKEGYTFVKWVDENGDDFDFSKPITSSTTLKAVWKANEVSPEAPTNNSNLGLILGLSIGGGVIVVAGALLFIFRKKIFVKGGKSNEK